MNTTTGARRPMWQMPIPDSDDLEGMLIWRERQAFEKWQRLQFKVSRYLAGVPAASRDALPLFDAADAARQEWEARKRDCAAHLELIRAGRA